MLQGEFTLFGGLEDCLEYIENFKLSDSGMLFCLICLWVVKCFNLDIEYLQTQLPNSTEPEFFQFLRSLNCNNIKFYAIDEGTVVFPKVPLITVEGPLCILQLLETTLLNLVNYARYLIELTRVIFF